jgi:3-oxoacyl-[acyl-carrier-protein] synthase II
VITGVGAVTPLGVGAPSLFERWAAGTCGIENGLGACSEFEPTEFLSKKQVRRNDRFTQLALVACDEALQSAGWNDGYPVSSERVGCVIGTGIGGLGTFETQHDVLRDEGIEQVSALAVPLMMPNAAAGALAMAFGLKGPAHSVGSACAASTDALGSALNLVRSGACEAVVAGGAEATLTPLAMAAFSRMGATSESGISRPFDARRDGFVMGEGSGVVVLEDAELAKQRGAPILCELSGYGASADAHHLTAPEPSGDGAARAMTQALTDAGKDPDAVSYINAHGTSTPLNDLSETEAIKKVFGDYAYSVPVSSTKSVIGHLLGAAGAVEAIATALALQNGCAPPTVGYGQPDDGLDLDYIPDTTRQLESHNGADALTALSNSFGFGGHNAVVCLTTSWQ